MKITLDLSRLVEDGKLTPEEAARLKGLASSEVGTLAFNILIGFGVCAVAAGAVALVPTPATAVATGLALFAGGFVVVRQPPWLVLGEICLIVGALMFCGGVLALGEGSLQATLIVTAALTLAAIAARSSLLMCFAVLGASACLGARTGYAHATYSLAIFEPTLTVVLFSVLAYVAFLASKQLSAGYERIALAAARMSIVLVNCGFWIGSLWGDPFFIFHGQRVPPRSSANIEIVIPAYAFSIAWAVALVAALLWGMRSGRAWLVNVVAVFGAIHFYTQWFEKLGATPLSVLVGGVMLLLAAIALRRFNRRPVETAPAPP
jgi:iron complex transport system permease protein